MEETKISKWQELAIFFGERIKLPVNHPEYILYFFIMIVGFGGTSIRYSLFSNHADIILHKKELINNITSFAVAVIASGSIELTFSRNKVLQTFLMLLTIFLIVLGLFAFYFSNKVLNYWIAIPFAAFALFIWWLSNATNGNLTQNFFVEQSKKSEKLGHSLDQYDEE